MPIYQYQCARCRHSLEPLISACAVSSEHTQRANLSAAHRKVTAARGDRLRDQHQHVYEHFEDGAAGPPEWYANHGVKGNVYRPRSPDGITGGLAVKGQTKPKSEPEPQQ
jgi:hypothetical protein